MPWDRHLAARLSAALLVATGIAILAGGLVLSYTTWKTADRVAGAYRLAAGGPTQGQATAALASLEGVAGADAAAARMHLHYAAAARADDRLEWRRQLLAALAAGRAALAESPIRGDVALLLADVEFVLFGPGEWVYQPLDLSFHAAPRERWLIFNRIGLDLRLVAAAPPEVKAQIAGDIRILGEPFRGTENYRRLAEAALAAGPPAIAAVRQELQRGHPWPLALFDQYLANPSAGPKPGAAAAAPLR